MWSLMSPYLTKTSLSHETSVIVWACAMTKKKKKTLRSDKATIVKDFSLLEKLPLRPLTKGDIIGRFNGIRGAVSFKKTPANNVLSERKTAHILANEIEELYCRFGLKIVVRSTLILKVLKTKTDNYKSSGAIHEVKWSYKDIRLADARQCQCQ